MPPPTTDSQYMGTDSDDCEDIFKRLLLARRQACSATPANIGGNK